MIPTIWNKALIVSAALALLGWSIATAQESPEAEAPTLPAGETSPDSPALYDFPEFAAPSPEAVATQVAGNNAFAWDLYSALASDDGNLFFSPFSVSTALGMTYAGAQGETAEQMASVMHFVLPDTELHVALGAMAQQLERPSEPVEGEGDVFRLNIANSVWSQQGMPVMPAFEHILSEAYGSDLKLVDFFNSSEEARQTINRWVAENTEDRIQDLLPQNSLDDLTRMVLANAVYFQASWASAFDPEATTEAEFATLDGSVVQVPMMLNTGRYGYVAGENYEAVELPYVGGDMSMVLIVPAAGSFGDVMGSFDADRYAALTEDIAYQSVTLALPRFEMRSEVAMSDVMKGLGMTDAFGEASDFSGINGGDDLLIDEIFHQAFVAVDETGTEAAAATAVVIRTRGSRRPDPIFLTVDRPFALVVRDREAGSIVFLGQVTNPLGG